MAGAKYNRHSELVGSFVEAQRAALSRSQIQYRAMEGPKK
jgi:hypothetical protein